MEDGWGHEFSITSEEAGIEDAEAMEEEGLARFFYHMGNGRHRRRGSHGGGKGARFFNYMGKGWQRRRASDGGRKGGGARFF